jgi:hypothetical protein
MCKGLFEDTKPRHSIALNRKGQAKKLQDTPKENHLFCTNCEKKFEIIETYFAKKTIDIHNYINLKDKIDLKFISNHQYLVCNHITPTLFKLFIYSLIWRASISNLEEFNRFNIEKKIEEELRVFLDSNLKETNKELLYQISQIEKYPKYHFCLIKPKRKAANSRGILTAFNTSETSYILVLVDFLIYFFQDENISTSFKLYSNKQNEKVIIALGEIEAWNELNLLIVQKMLK